MTLKTIKQVSATAMLSLLLLISIDSSAQKTFVGTSGTNWNVAASWSPSGIPTASDCVLIPNAKNVVINIAAVCKSITMQTGATTTTLSISSTNSLTVSNQIYFAPVTTGNNYNHTLAIGTGTVTCKTLLFDDNKSGTRITQVTMSSGKLTVTGNVTLLGTNNNENKITMTGAANLVIGGNFTATSTFAASLTTFAGSKVIFNGANAQTISSGFTYADMQFYGAGTKTFSGSTTTTVGKSSGDSLDIRAGTTVNVGTLLFVTGAAGRVYNIAGTLITANTAGFSGGASTTFPSTNAPTINLVAGSTIHYNSASAQAITTRTDYKALEISGASTKTISGTTTIANNLVVNTGATLAYNAAALNVTGNITSDGNLTATSGTLTISGDFSNTGTFTCGTGTVNYNRAGIQVVKGTTYNNLTISGSGIKSMAASAGVNAILLLTAGNLSIGANTLTLNGTFSVSGTGTLIGSTTSSMSIGGSSEVGTLRFDNTSRANKTLSSFTLNNTNVGSSVTLNNAATADTLLISDVLTLTDGALISNGRLLLLSNASTTARVAAVTQGSITGNIHVERFIPGGVNKRKWRFMSFPVNNSGTMTWQAIKDYIMVTGIGTGFDAGLGNSTPSLRTYNEAIAGSSSNGWTNPNNITNTVSTGVGFEVFVRGTRGLANQFVAATVPDNVTFRFSGTMNTGNVSVGLIYNNSGNTGDGLNLVGNPYPSQIDFRTGVNLTNADDKFWCYNPNTEVYGLYDISLNSGTNNITQFIASGQGFFVQALGGSASIQFTESSKTSNTPNNYFRTNAVTNNQIVKLSLTSYNNNKDQLLVAFEPNASSLYGDRDDAIKIFNDKINFYSKSSDNINLTINQHPTIGALDTINLCVYSNDTMGINVGQHYIQLDELINFNTNNELYLLDSYTNTTTNLLVTDKYYFNIDTATATWGVNRFKLVFKTINTSIYKTDAKFEFQVYPNPTNNYIYIDAQNIKLTKNCTYKIIDMYGKVVLYKSYQEEAINIDALAAGMYYIELQSGEKVGMSKFVKL